MNEKEVGKQRRDMKRKEFREKHKQRMEGLLAKGKQYARENFIGIEYIITKPDEVDMQSFRGTAAELEYAIEHLYTNWAGDFNPSSYHPPSLLSNFGKDYAFHAQGVYYHDQYSEDAVVCNRKVWVPTISKSDWDNPELYGRRERARVFANHSKDNGKWQKSEYAWEADAWSDVFRPMREDPCLEIDKHACLAPVAETDPVYCKLTGTTSFVKRTPDATFGLATYVDGNAEDAETWVPELHEDRLQKLLLHPKYGLVSDPKRTDIGLVFPFMVYEAKGWSGDCREARRQACAGGKYYLDMLDELARKPGPVGTPRVYQTKTSHQYQVFALTSFGAYWHLLVGHQRPRAEAEHAGVEGMSDTVYIFQKIWSGHVISESTAWELLSLIDQIHLWATTDHRTFVLEHLRPWHDLCQENFLLEWDSRYDLGTDKKRKRRCSDFEDIKLPAWAASLNEPIRRKLQERAWLILFIARQQNKLIKGKTPCRDSDDSWHCELDECTAVLSSGIAALDHLKSTHGMEERFLASLRWLLEKRRADELIRERQDKGITATGSRWLSWPSIKETLERDGVEALKPFAVPPWKRIKTS